MDTPTPQNSPLPTPDKRKGWIILIVVAILIVAGGWYLNTRIGWWAHLFLRSGSTQQPPITSPSEKDQIVQVYKNDKYGFEVKAPPEWGGMKVSYSNQQFHIVSVKDNKEVGLNVYEDKIPLQDWIQQYKELLSQSILESKEKLYIQKIRRIGNHDVMVITIEDSMGYSWYYYVFKNDTGVFEFTGDNQNYLENLIRNTNASTEHSSRGAFYFSG